MSRFIDIISPIYQDLLNRCDRRKITINLDIQDLTLKVDDDQVRDFYEKELKRAYKLCDANDKITIMQSVSENTIRLSVKNSSNKQLDAKTVEELRQNGYEVRSRFGYDTIVTLKIDK